MAAQIDNHIEDLAGHDADEFPLRLADLIVEPSQDMTNRAGVVVLNERTVGARSPSKEILAVAFKKEATLVAVDHRLEDEHATETGLDDLHMDTP